MCKLMDPMRCYSFYYCGYLDNTCRWWDRCLHITFLIEFKRIIASSSRDANENILFEVRQTKMFSANSGKGKSLIYAHFCTKTLQKSNIYFKGDAECFTTHYFCEMRHKKLRIFAVAFWKKQNLSFSRESKGITAIELWTVEYGIYLKNDVLIITKKWLLHLTQQKSSIQIIIIIREKTNRILDDFIITTYAQTVVYVTSIPHTTYVFVIDTK